MDFDGFELLRSAPTPAPMSETMRVMFLFRTKKNVFFLKKWIFGTLHYSTAMPKVSFRAKIADFMKIIDFHWFLSKNMDFDAFEWSQGAPTPATMSETMRDMFLFRKKKYVF